MNTPPTPKSRAPMATAMVALVVIGFAMGVFWQSRSDEKPAPSAEPDLTSIRESLQKEATNRLGTSLESQTLTVTLKPGTLDQAQNLLREQACLPLGDTETESRWLFQGTLEESKRLEQALSPLGVVAATGSSPGDKLLMNITLVGGRP